jgi:hypothetical protein
MCNARQVASYQNTDAVLQCRVMHQHPLSAQESHKISKLRKIACELEEKLLEQRSEALRREQTFQEAGQLVSDILGHLKLPEDGAAVKTEMDAMDCVQCGVVYDSLRDGLGKLEACLKRRMHADFTCASSDNG